MTYRAGLSQVTLSVEHRRLEAKHHVEFVAELCRKVRLDLSSVEVDGRITRHSVNQVDQYAFVFSRIYTPEEVIVNHRLFVIPGDTQNHSIPHLFAHQKREGHAKFADCASSSTSSSTFMITPSTPRSACPVHPLRLLS